MTPPVVFVVRLIAVVLCQLCALLAEPDSLLRPSTAAEIGRRAPAFTQPYSYADGLDVVVTETWLGQRLFLPVAELTVVVRNGSSHTFEAWLIGELAYGSRRQSALRCPVSPGSGDDLGGAQLIAMGESSYPYRLCFVLSPADRDDVVFELRIDPDGHEPAVFAGGL